MSQHNHTNTDKHKQQKANKKLETANSGYISFRLLALILAVLIMLMLIPTCIPSQQNEVTHEQR